MFIYLMSNILIRLSYASCCDYCICILVVVILMLTFNVVTKLVIDRNVANVHPLFLFTYLLMCYTTCNVVHLEFKAKRSSWYF